MSRHEMIKMFELIMKALLILVYRNSSVADPLVKSLKSDYVEFLRDLEFKPEK